MSDGLAIGGRVAVWVGFVPEAPLIPGEDYVFSLPHCPGEVGTTIAYHAIEPIAEPTSLGTIEVSPLYATNLVRGVANRVHFVEVTLHPDPAVLVEPWSNTVGVWAPFATIHEYPLVEIDYRYPDSHRARVTVLCHPYPGIGIPTGPQTFRGATTGEFSALRVSTPDVDTIIGDCGAAQRVDADTLEPLTPDEMTFWDTEAPPVSADGSCSIGAGRRPDAAPWALSALCAIALVWARRRAPIESLHRVWMRDKRVRAVYLRAMTSALACFSGRSLVVFSLLLLALSQAGCGDPCDGPRPPFICSAVFGVLADLPAGQAPTVTPVGTTNTQPCSSGGSVGVYQCSVVIEGRRPGTTLDVTVAAPGATPQTVTLVFGAPLSSACFACATVEPVASVDLRPGAVDAGLP